MHKGQLRLDLRSCRSHLSYKVTSYNNDRIVLTISSSHVTIQHHLEMLEKGGAWSISAALTLTSMSEQWWKNDTLCSFAYDKKNIHHHIAPPHLDQQKLQDPTVRWTLVYCQRYHQHASLSQGLLQADSVGEECKRLPFGQEVPSRSHHSHRARFVSLDLLMGLPPQYRWRTSIHAQGSQTLGQSMEGWLWGCQAGLRESMALHSLFASSEPFQEWGQGGRVDKEVDSNHL